MVTSVHLLKAALAGEVRRVHLPISITFVQNKPLIKLQFSGPFSTLLPCYLKLKMLVICVQSPPPIIIYLIFSSVILFCEYECAGKQ